MARIKKKGGKGNGEEERKGRKERVLMGGNGTARAPKLLGAAEDVVDVSRREWNRRAHRMVIPLETIIALRRKGLSYPQVAKVLGCSKRNVQERLKKVAEEIERVEDFKEARADLFAVHQNRVLSSITSGDLKKAGLKDKAAFIAAIYDRERLERGKMTSIVGYADLVRMKTEKQKELEELESGQESQ